MGTSLKIKPPRDLEDCTEEEILSQARELISRTSFLLNLAVKTTGQKEEIKSNQELLGKMRRVLNNRRSKGPP